MLSKLAPAPESRKPRKRVGRGESSGHGKTSSHGGKGQTARTGGGVRQGFEGGQMPLYRRVSKLGFTSFRRAAGINSFSIINLEQLDKISDSGVVEFSKLVEKGIVGKNERVKLLGRGAVSKGLTVKVHAISTSARKAIEGAGGKVEILA